MGCGSSKAQAEFFHKYDLADFLGSGSYGSVGVARNVESSDQLAVNILNLKARGEDSKKPTRRQLRAAVAAERRAWTHIGFHPNVVSLRETFEDHRFAYFVMELCSSSLLEAWKSESDLNEYTYARYFKEMAQALVHLHSVRIVHRDVKHDNFMVGAPDGRTVKLCDFGVSAVMRPGELSGYFGTAPYMAPEMLHSTHGPPADVWSLGVIVYVAFFGCWPYQPKQKSAKEMRNVIRHGSILPNFAPANSLQQSMVSEEGINFVKGLLNRSPLARPSAASCLEMEYLSDGRRNHQQGNISLALLLEGAITCGGLNLRQPNVGIFQAMEFNKLQSTARSRAWSSQKSLPSSRTGFRSTPTAIFRDL